MQLGSGPFSARWQLSYQARLCPDGTCSHLHEWFAQKVSLHVAATELL